MPLWAAPDERRPSGDGGSEGEPGGTPEGESGDDTGTGDDRESSGTEGESGDEAEGDTGSTDEPVDRGALNARTLDLQLLEATDEPGTFDDLVPNPATCTDGDTLTLTQSITGGRLTIGCTLTLHLAGHTLTTAGVLVTPTKTLTINSTGETGTLIAAAADESHAGIQTTGAKLVINGGTITATGGHYGAGIGGGDGGHGGAINITGGTTTATGGTHGAGIGGGSRGDGGIINITGGTTTATGGQQGAGIGGGNGGDGGNITITGDTTIVTATGGEGGAGIGGGDGGHGGNINITGGTTTATGVRYGAGIGGGSDGNGGNITITGGTVTATAGSSGVGIGGGYGADGGNTIITGGTTTASGGVSAVGQGGAGDGFGSLMLEGTLHVPSGPFVIPNSNAAGAEVVITSTGKLLGAAADPTTGASITGAGQITNGGVIALATSLVDAAVTGNSFEVAFDAQDGENPASVRVFAPTFASGYRSLPLVPGGGAWNTADDGSGAWFAPTTALSADITLYALRNAESFAHSTANCTDGDAITLIETISTGRLTIGCTLTLHLAGYTLETEGVLVTTDKTLTINSKGETGTLIAAAANTTDAGIQNTGAKLVINGGTITATGGLYGAGIGGGYFGGGGATTISGGTITTTGGQYGCTPSPTRSSPSPHPPPRSIRAGPSPSPSPARPSTENPSTTSATWCSPAASPPTSSTGSP